jgi:hypothetical protein
LLIAAVIAYCNAVASAQLAAVYPTSGGTRWCLVPDSSGTDVFSM